MLEKSAKKPRLVFFQWKHDMLPNFLQSHMQLHVKCLSEFFDVILINRDCDYQQVCDIYEPDLTLFESGFRSTLSKKIKISNTFSHPTIPKLGLHNGDAWCDCRVGFISDMEKWGIETFFSISTTMAEHTPEISCDLFIWPNFVDRTIYRDYKQSKIIPFTFNGNINSLYPWRQEIFHIITKHYPSFIFPHLGYESSSPFMICGEQYARTINASYFVPACGTVAKEVVRKHFEIPGAKACLITEKSPMLEAAGFVDMHNCVFADGNTVLDKLSYLFKNLQELKDITDRGYKLVHSHHTLQQRNQILQWFNLNKELKSNEKIVQTNPFEELRIVNKSTKVSTIKCDGLHLILLQNGDKKLWDGEFDEAEQLYLKCLEYVSWMSEPKLKLAICNLYKGDAEKALFWIMAPIQHSLGSYGAPDPDPIEWSYFIISLLCTGRLKEAIIRANQYPSLYHPELHRTRFVVSYFQNMGKNIPELNYFELKQRRSVHQLPQLSFSVWIENLCCIFRACHKLEYVEVIKEMNYLDNEASEKGKLYLINREKFFSSSLLMLYISYLEKINSLFEELNVPKSRKALPSIDVYDMIFRLAKWGKIGLAKTFKRCLFYLESKFRSFNLFKIKKKKNYSRLFKT
ncbi:glycosyltransferase [Pontibacter ramchanderi]|uniref:Glycosyl transferase family 1 n=1 Tax=Pontibacter ramchanderi TaxID=1179743 RepID=A0A2N3V1L7_9BACT|nr:glycosyltransferase [Pontibacter ramchanderi]PKV75520.1 glycosyl transferase family 1 [Pontibacter ramchanderi]